MPWRLAVLLPTVAAASALAGWWLATDADQRGPVGMAVVVVGLPLLAGALGLLRVREVELRRDAQGWQLADAGGPARDVEIEVAVDLGAAMLLRARAAGALDRWLPVDRRALGPLWPALRRAVYSPRPAGGSPASADRPDPTA